MTACNQGQRFEPRTCACLPLPVMDTCYQGSVSGGSLTTYKVYLMNVVLMGILVIIVVISIYWLACRTNKQQRRVQVLQIFFHGFPIYIFFS